MENGRRFTVPPMVEGRALAAGEMGLRWLAELDDLVGDLEARWKIHVESVMSGGSHAFVGLAIGTTGATGTTGEGYVLKVDFPDNSVAEYMQEVRALQIADGHGYVKVLECDPEKHACLLERLGKRLKALDYSVERQMEIICDVLKESWQIKLQDPELPDGSGSIAWFRGFIAQAWEELGRPCPEKVIGQAMRCLDAREAKLDPRNYVLVHGDAHNNNTLQVPGEEGRFRLIDPDGIFYEKAYDLGVLMREWPEEYREDPMAKGRERAEFLHRLTGAGAQGIWEWGFLQMVSTSLVLLQIGQVALAQEMLTIAEAWCE